MNLGSKRGRTAIWRDIYSDRHVSRRSHRSNGQNPNRLAVGGEFRVGVHATANTAQPITWHATEQWAPATPLFSLFCYFDFDLSFYFGNYKSVVPLLCLYKSNHEPPFLETLYSSDRTFSTQ